VYYAKVRAAMKASGKTAGMSELFDALLDAMSDDEIVERHGNLILPSQEHCARELDAAMPWLDDRGVVVIDDAALPGGGKARLARKILEREGWRCALDAYQTVWVRA